MGLHIPGAAFVNPNTPLRDNHFHAAGGIGFLIGTLLDAGLLHEDVRTVWGTGLAGYRIEASLTADGSLDWRPATPVSHDPAVLRPATEPFQATGGLKLLAGNIGHAAIKVSAVKPERHAVEAAAIVFHSQDALLDVFRSGALNRDFIAVGPFQGPKANGLVDPAERRELFGTFRAMAGPAETGAGVISFGDAA